MSNLPVKTDAGSGGAASTFSQWAFRLLFGGRMTPFESLPGPTPALPFGNGGDFFGKPPWEVLGGYHERYGTRVLFWILGSAQVLVTDPELVERVLEGDFDRYDKNQPLAALLPILSDTCEFVANGERWKRDREVDPVTVVIPPGVCPHAPDGTAPSAPPIDLAPVQKMLAERARALAATTSDRDLRPEIVRLAFDALTLQLFGTSLDDGAYADYAKLTDAASQRVISSIPSFLSTFGFYPARRRWRRRIEAVVAEAKRGLEGKGPVDILRTTLRRGTMLDDPELALAIGQSVFGGTQSVASGILSVLYFAAQRRDVSDRIQAEVRALPGGAARASYAEIDACETLDHALLEGLRLYPPAPVYMREVGPQGPTDLGGVSLPPGTTVYITPWPMHRSRDHWGDDADTFRPERWENGGKQRDPLGSGYYFPFGRGRRACAGEGLAHVTMKLALAAIFEVARPVMDEGQPYESDFYFGVLLPKTMSGRLVAG